MYQTAESSTVQGTGEAIMPDPYRPLTWMCFALLVAALWMATRPYVGVTEDARFYTVEALNQIVPGRFANDLYFRYGSQGDFTLFTQLYKPFLVLFGIVGGNLALTVMVEAMWLSGLFYLAWTLFRNLKMVAIAMVAVILLPGGIGIPYGEQFLTPRLLVEGLTFWALGSMLAERPFRALFLLCAALTMHPIMALPGLAVLFLYEVAKRPALWAAAFLAGVGICAMALLGIQPFARLGSTFDPAWFSVVRARNFYCLIAAWDSAEWVPAGAAFVIALFAMFFSRPVERRLIAAALVVGAAGLVVSFAGGDLLHNVLILDMQAWRCVWLLAALGHLFLARVVLFRPQHGRLAGVNVPLLFLLGLVIGLVIVLFSVVFGKQPLLVNPAPSILLCSFITALLSALIFVQQKSRGWAIGLVMILSAGVFVVAGLAWDQRAAWTTYVDTIQAPPPDLVKLLPETGPIYWDGEITAPWFLLKRASYFSCDQGTGVLFSRNTAMNYAQRYEAFLPLRSIDFRHYRSCLPEKLPTAVPDRTTLTVLCGKEAELSALILTTAVRGAPPRVWIAPVKFDISQDGVKMFETNRFYIYSCADFRGRGLPGKGV